VKRTSALSALVLSLAAAGAVAQQAPGVADPEAGHGIPIPDRANAIDAFLDRWLLRR